MKTKFRWRKCPAVRQGGKAWFWHAKTENGHQFWIAWHRFRRAYTIKHEDRNGVDNIGTALKPAEGRKFAENWLASKIIAGEQ